MGFKAIKKESVILRDRQVSVRQGPCESCMKYD